MSIQDSIKSAMLTAAPSFSMRNNEPTAYTDDRQFQYYDDDNTLFTFKYAQYATDYVVAEIQGLTAEEPESWTRIYIRLADLVKASASMSNDFDNYKMILVCGLAPRPETDENGIAVDGRKYCGQDKAYVAVNNLVKNNCYIKRGSKLTTMGSTWLVTNPQNMSDAGKAVIQRCNTTWRYHDFYGNVCSEPICVYPQKMRANDPDAQRSSMITKGYFDGLAQYNKATKNLRTNSRMILGSSAYMLSGYSDWSQEFTDDDSSTNIVYFSLRYDEPNDAKDDMVNRIADGKLFNWEIRISGQSMIKAGETTQLAVISKRNDEVVTSTEENPISYSFTSSDEAVAIVDENGLVTGTGNGTAIITVSLDQNPNNNITYEIKVEGDMSATQVAFNTTIPDTLSMFETATISASYYEDGEMTTEPITWSFGSADPESYSYILNADNSVTVKCWGGSVESLVITASYGEYSDSAEIQLRGL